MGTLVAVGVGVNGELGVAVGADVTTAVGVIVTVCVGVAVASATTVAVGVTQLSVKGKTERGTDISAARQVSPAQACNCARWADNSANSAGVALAA